MTYQDAIAFIHNTTYRGGKDDLNNMKALLAYLDHPEKDVPMLHVAGTNGKGSVCACLQAMLRCAGYRVGLYTSPYLQRYNERMRVDGEPIPDALLAMHMDRIAAVVWKLRAQGIWPTEFEIGTALAFVYFASAKVDIAVIEVGLGGRLDPTNVIHPLVSVITAIGMDHMRYLGN
ncbi:MAG: Mur ligase family protein, partial [Clostridia bacterium]